MKPDYEYFEGRTKEERHNNLIDKMRAVCTALGTGWTTVAVRSVDGEIIPERAKLIHNDYGYHIFVRYDIRKPEQLRYKADGSYYNGKAIHKELKPIFITMCKSAEVIARDLERRILPDLRMQDRIARINQRKAQEYDEAVNNNCWKLINATNAHASRSRQPNDNTVFYFGENKKFTAKVRDTSVELTLEDLSPDDAAEILEWFFFRRRKSL